MKIQSGARINQSVSVGFYILTSVVPIGIPTELKHELNQRYIYIEVIIFSKIKIITLIYVHMYNTKFILQTTINTVNELMYTTKSKTKR